MLKKIAVITGIICILSALILVIAFGITSGTVMAFIFGIILIITALCFHKMPNKLQKLLIVLSGAGIIAFLVIISIIVVRGNRDSTAFDEDCVLVLGCGIRGETILPVLQSRLDKCLEYLSVNPNVPVFVSGGKGHNENIPEAEAMKRYLVQHGIDETQIFMEDQSTNTIENFVHSGILFEKYFEGKFYTVACITSDYHVYRSEMIASDFDIETHFYAAGVRWYLRLAAYCREVLSICKYWIFN